MLQASIPLGGQCKATATPTPSHFHHNNNKNNLNNLNRNASFKRATLINNRRSISPITASYSSSSGGGGGGERVEPPVKALRRLLSSPGIHLGPACFDALSAKLVQRAGFDFCFTSGFSISAARLGQPDAGLISYGEMLDQGQKITDAVSIPVIGDGDNGYGNAMNVKRTVKGYIKAGFAGIILEDQASPKACGHTQGRKVVAIDEAIMRIKAAVDARRESGSDIVIVARTDSRQAISFEESLRRSRAFADAGADVLFIDALATRDEIMAFGATAPSVPKMANMLEGGGKTPILTPIELEDLGYKIVAYPLSLIGVSIQAMQDALSAIRRGRIPSPGSMPSFDEIKDILGFNDYYEEEKRYSLSTSQPAAPPADVSAYSIIRNEQSSASESGPSQQDSTVEVMIPEVYSGSRAGGSSNSFRSMWSRTLRIKITGKDGVEKLDVRIPVFQFLENLKADRMRFTIKNLSWAIIVAGFLDGITNIVPALVGVNIKELIDNATEGMQGQLLDFNDTPGDRIQVFLE